MKKTTYFCDACSEEYKKGNYGMDGELNLFIQYTDSTTERRLCKMDLCESCVQKVEKSIQSVIVNSMNFKDAV